MWKYALAGTFVSVFAFFGVAQRPVDFAQVKRFEQEAFASKRSAVELIEHGRSLLTEGSKRNDCDVASLGIALMAFGWNGTTSTELPPELRTLQLPAGCDPDFPNYHYQLGAAFYKLGKYADATLHFERVAAFENCGPSGWDAIGACQYSANNLEAATEAYERALALTTGEVNLQLLNNLSALYLALHRPDRARKIAQQGLDALLAQQTPLSPSANTDLSLMLHQNLLAAAIQLQDTASATAEFRIIDQARLPTTQFLSSLFLYSIFTESAAARDLLVDRATALAPDELRIAFSPALGLLRPDLLAIHFENSGNLDAAWAYFVAAKRLHALPEFEATLQQPAESERFATRNYRLLFAGAYAAEAVLVLLLSGLIYVFLQLRRQRHRAIWSSGTAAGEPEPASRAADLEELHREIAAGSVRSDWAARWEHTSGADAGEGLSPEAEFRNSLNLNVLEYNVLEMSARGLNAKSIAQALDRTPGYILNRRSVLRQRLGIPRDMSIVAWWKQHGPRALGLFLAFVSATAQAAGGAVEVWQAALAEEDSAAIRVHASTWAASLADAAPDLPEIGLFTESMLYAPDLEQWERLRPRLEAAIRQDTAAAADLLGPLKWVYAPWRMHLEREARAVAGEDYRALSPAGVWAFVGPLALRKELLPNALIARLPAPSELKAWWEYQALRRLMVHLGAVLVLAIAVLVLWTRFRKLQHRHATAAAAAPGASGYLGLLLAAARAGKPQSLQFALWEACAFDSGNSPLQGSAHLPAAWHRLNGKEQLLLHLLHQHVSAADCAHVLGCSEPYLYAMRSTVRKKLGLDAGQRLEHELAQWTRKGRN